MKKLDTKQIIKIIKQNLSLPTYRLAKKVKLNPDELLKFCRKNNISLSKSNKDEFVLKFIKAHPNLSVGMLVRYVGCSKEYLADLIQVNKIKDDRFRDLKLTKIRNNISTDIASKNKKWEADKSTITNVAPPTKIEYQKISHDEISKILLQSDTIATKFVRDLGGLGIGEALVIKKPDWTITNSPYFYFRKITLNTPIKVKVKIINNTIYAIRTR